jgi:hypothetical protein
MMSSEKFLEDDNFSNSDIPDWVVGAGIITVILNVIGFGLLSWVIGIYQIICWIF